MSFIPYCGNAPTPGAVAWNLDPILIAALATCGVACARWGRRGRPLALDQLALFCAGWSTLGLALISPLCNLSVALFSARVSQHVVLTLVAAPLIAAGLAFRKDRIASGIELWSVCGVFACVLWFWHSPGPYDASLRNNYVYWVMQISIIASGIGLWQALARSGPLTAFLAVTATGVQMSLLGAVLTFARDRLFSVHELTTTPWGLTQLEDQQLGGLLMWIPAGLLLTLYSVVAFGRALSRMEAGARSADSIARTALGVKA